jgi:hypothetical protein
MAELEYLLGEYSDLRRTYAVLSRYATATQEHVDRLRRIIEETNLERRAA